MDDAFHERVREGFLQLAVSEPDRIALVDASSDPDAVSATIRGLVARRLDLGSP
jgi:dTMP kinase